MQFPPRPPPVRLGVPIIGHQRCPVQHNIYSRALTGVRVRITEQPAGPFHFPLPLSRTRDRNRPRLRASPETASPGSHSRPRARVFRAVAAVGTKVVGCAAATANTNPPASGSVWQEYTPSASQVPEPFPRDLGNTRVTAEAKLGAGSTPVRLGGGAFLLLASFPSGVAAGTRSSQPLFCELNP